MDSVYLLWHVHERRTPKRDNASSRNELLIGVYVTEGDAKSAIERLRSKPGFRETPEGFSYERYELNRDHWTEGFVLDPRS